MNSRARALLRAERAEVATLLRQTEEGEIKVDLAPPDSATDFEDEALPLTEEAEDDGAVAAQLRERLGRDRPGAGPDRGRPLWAVGAQRPADPGRAA